MKTNHVREKLKAGKPTVGCFLGLGSPNVAWLLANAGLDWLVIETEHNGLDSAEVEHMLMAVAGTDVVPIVRVPSSNRVYIQRALDHGGNGRPGADGQVGGGGESSRERDPVPASRHAQLGPSASESVRVRHRRLFRAR